MLYFAYGAARGASTFVRAGDRASNDAGSAADRESDGGDHRTSDGGDHRTSDGEGDQAIERSRNDEDSRGFRKAFALAITNPYQLLFWLTVGVRLLEPGTVDVFAQSPVGGALAGQLLVETGSPALVVGFFGGIVAWILALPTALTSARHRLEAAAPIVAGASALVLAGYGIVFLVDAVTTLSG
jgi:threonine/homoserine/homoserine lactone efflux protein